MTGTCPASISYPITAPRPNAADPPAILRELRDEDPLRPMTFAEGRQGWLATGYSAVRTVLADPRFSAKQELMVLPVDAPGATKGVPAEPGAFIRMDPPEHTRYRSKLIAEFTVRRMNQLEPRIAKVTHEALDAMEVAGPPVDLIQAFALPIPSLVMCDLFGIPAENRADFERAMAITDSFESTREEVQNAFATMLGYFPPLIESKRKNPTDDLFSGIANDSDFTVEELTNIGLTLFAGGFESTTHMIGLGVYSLLTNPPQADALRKDPKLVDGAVEELLRYLSIVHRGPIRVALEDVEVEGRLIEKGQPVMMSFPAANRDPDKYEDPESLDVTRSARGHLAFGHGVHQCIGQQLARVEMRIAFAALFERFPTLRLDIAPEDVAMKDQLFSTIHGLQKLPVAW
ncbi:cytochrome P450 [Streptomyces sp. CA-250714]|uniref:cytochrome P450 n=1 Tax=Streptomyces sp. CA-250714 TaxID=3240060 RepID=UPI003D94DEB1